MKVNSWPTAAVYLNFGDMNLPNNDYLTISQLGNDTDTGLGCRTDQPGDGEGGWIDPSGTMLHSSSEGFFVNNGEDGVYLLRGTGVPVEGIYTCIATDSSGNTRPVNIGIYDETGTRGIMYTTIYIISLSLACR